eukprot:COSAG05_NODE_21869_length_268_cov_2.142012_1_plen_22_part_10
MYAVNIVMHLFIAEITKHARMG